MKFLLLSLVLSLFATPAFADESATRDLYTAIRNADLPGIEKAIKAGADIDADWSTNEIHSQPDSHLYVTHRSRYDHYTPMEYAYRFYEANRYGYDREGALRVIEKLLSAGANAQPILTSAAWYGDLELVKKIQAKSKKRDLKNCDVLHNAVESRNLELVKSLLAAGADPKCRYYDEPVLAYSSTAEIAQALLDAGADFETKSDTWPVFESALSGSRLFPFIPFAQQDNPSYYNEGRDRALALLLRKGAPIRWAWQIPGFIGDAKRLNFKETVAALEERQRKSKDAKLEAHAKTTRPNTH